MSASNPTSGPRLDSWKEIAGFFGRDERTVNRWEKELGLPVHRLPGTKGRVYAYTEELSAWLAAPRDAAATLAVCDSGGLTIVARAASVDAPLSAEQSAPEGVTLSRSRKTLRLLTAAIAGTGAVALLFLFHPSLGFKKKNHEESVHGQTSPDGSVLASTPSHNPEAEQLYLKGRYYWNKRTPGDLNKALDYFMQAVVHDPNYSQAYVGLADCYNLMREFTLMPSSEAYPRALAAAEKAVELDDQSSEAHASLAFVSFFGMWDVAGGEREFRRAIDLNPNNPAPHHWYANALMALRRFPEAQAEIDRAQSLDPVSTAIMADKGNILCRSGRQAEGLSLLKQIESREPGFRSPHLYLEGVYFSNQDYPNFLPELRKDGLLVHDDSSLAIATAAERGFAAEGAHGMLEAMLPVEQELYAHHSIPPTALAQTYARLGKKNEALHYLNAAYEQRDGLLLFVEIYSEFDSLRDEPAYRDLLARINLPIPTAP